jgi:hypothetical protein
LFNLNISDSNSLKILTILVNGKPKNNLLGFYFPSLKNDVTKENLINYYTKLYGNYTFADSGLLENDVYNNKNIINPFINSEYAEKKEIFHGGKPEDIYVFNDYVYRWSYRNYDIEVIQIGMPFCIYINYKIKNFNDFYQQYIKEIRSNYSIDDLVRFSFRKPYIEDISEVNFNKKLIIPVDYITRDGLFEPRTITDLKFDIGFFDEFENLIFTLNDLKWDREIKFEKYLTSYNEKFIFKYNTKNCSDCEALYKLENKINKVKIVPKIKALRFEDGVVLK